MSIYVIGINYKSAPIAVREQLYFAEEKLGLYVQDLLQQSLVSEVVLLSTCNRSEMYCVTDDVAGVIAWLHQQTTLDPAVLSPLIYCYQDIDALKQMTFVASGLDSMVLGEPQIFGQLKAAYSESVAAGGVGPILERVFPPIFGTVKMIRSVTRIGACPVSVASSANHFAKSIVPNWHEASVLVIGAGETVALLLPYLTSEPKQSIHLVNRSVASAKQLAAPYPNIEVHEWQALPQLLSRADLIISATGSPHPILTLDMLRAVDRGDLPLYCLDLAVPRDIDENITKLFGVHLYSIDDLMAIIEQHKRGREHAANEARTLIHERSMLLWQDLQSVDHVSHTIRAYRGQIEELCHLELVKAQEQLKKGANAEDILNTFAKAYTNKLLHIPSVQLRQAGREGRLELLHFAKQLFDLTDTP